MHDTTPEPSGSHLKKRKKPSEDDGGMASGSGSRRGSVAPSSSANYSKTDREKDKKKGFSCSECHRRKVRSVAPVPLISVCMNAVLNGLTAHSRASDYYSRTRNVLQGLTNTSSMGLFV